MGDKLTLSKVGDAAMMQDFFTVVRRWKDFSGRSSRKEFWMFNLWYLVLFTLLAAADAWVFGEVGGLGGQSYEFDGGATFDGDVTVEIHPLNFANLFTLILLLPGLAVAVRRLHDVNRTGWWCLLYFTLIGMIPLLYWFVRKSDDGENRFGAAQLR